MADGSITFSTALDNKQLEIDLKSAVREVDSLKRKLEGQQFEQSWLEKMMDRASSKADAAKARVDELTEKIKALESEQSALDTDDMEPATIERWRELGDQIMATYGRLRSAQGSYDAGLAEWKSYSDRWDVASSKARSYEEAIGRAKGRASELAAEASKAAQGGSSVWQRAAEAIRSRFSTAAEGIRNKMAQAASKSVSPWEQFSRRVSGLLKRVFLFGVILKGLNAIKNAIGSMLMQNERFSSSVANLKATFNGVLSAIVQAALPALTALVNTLAGVLERIAGLVDSIFGTNLVAGIRGQRQAEGDAIRQANAQKQAAYDAQVAQEQARYEEELAKAQEKQAKAEERQAKAAEKEAKAQEKANRQLMAFDEINALSAESTEEATEAIEDYMDGIEGPDFSSIEAPELETDWTLGDFGDAGMLKGVLDWLDELRDRILNDVEGPFARIREGLELIKQGWDKLVEGVRTGNLGLVIEGLRDIVLGVVYAIEGSINAFLGWLDEQTGGRFHEIIEGIQTMVHGLAEVIAGILTGDIPRAIDGLKLIVDGAAQALRGVIDQICKFLEDTVDRAFNNLSEKFPELKWLFDAARDHAKGAIEAVRQFLDDFITGAKDMIKGGLDIVLGILTGDRDRVLRGLDEFKNGVDRRIQGIVDFARNLLNNAFNSLRQAIDGAFKFLSEKFPAAERLFTALKAKILTILNTLQSTFNGIMNGITGAVRKFVDGLGQIFRGGIDVVVGIATGSGERVRDGLKGIVNGFVTIIEGLVDNVIYGLVGFANGVIDSLSVLPGVSIPSIQFSGVSLPRLAQGAVIPPNREFMAVLGDQPRGNNIETPESLMRQVVREETGPLLADAVAALLGGSGGRSGDVVLMVGRKELARETMRGMRELSDTGELGDRSGIVFA